MTLSDSMTPQPGGTGHDCTVKLTPKTEQKARLVAGVTLLQRNRSSNRSGNKFD